MTAASETQDKRSDELITASRAQDDITSEWNSDPGVLVSVCCITYNHEMYIREAIDSFLMQETDFPFEVIIHDDASTDRTAYIIKAYEKAYPKIIKPIYQTENQYSICGLINPRLVIPKARGKYIALCEGDDYWTDKTKLQKQADFLENNAEYVITYTDCQPFDEKGAVHAYPRGVKEDLESIELIKSTPISTLTVCFRNVLGEISQDLMSARYGDLVMWSLLGAHGKGKYLDDILPSAYRVHDGGAHSRKPTKEKAGMSVITYAALYSYYKRRDEEDICQYFETQLLKNALLLNGFDGAWKYFLSVLAGKIKRTYKKWIK